MDAEFPMGAHEVCPHKTSLAFVDAPCEIFGPLVAGRPLVVLPDEVTGDPLAFVDALAACAATRIVVVPSVLRALLEHGGATAQTLPALQLWVCSGEALTAELAALFHGAFPLATLLNLYGSTRSLQTRPGGWCPRARPRSRSALRSPGCGCGCRTLRGSPARWMCPVSSWWAAWAWRTATTSAWSSPTTASSATGTEPGGSGRATG
jgi:non-ribosomal peptide synthetase component F